MSISRSRQRAIVETSPDERLLPERTRRALILAALAASSMALVAGTARAQELRGSPASVEKMYYFATNHRMAFYRTPEDVAAAAQRGKLMQLAGGPGWELSTGVGWAYATPEAVAFLDQLGPEYVENCQAPMVVTSATRPLSRRPRNGHQQSVHPTGIAVDLRKPYRGPCLDWLRKRLLQLEAAGRIEAIEERHPPHFHVAVLSRPGTAPARSMAARMASAEAVARQLGTSRNTPWGPPMSNRPTGPARTFRFIALSPFARRTMPRLPGVVVMAQAPAPAAPALAAAQPPQPAQPALSARDSLTLSVATGSVALADTAARPPAPPAAVAATEPAKPAPKPAAKEATTEPAKETASATYIVRPGDTLWEIARKHGVTVDALLAANKLGKGKTLRPKMALKIPAKGRATS